jgi:hypothetical protein
MKLLALSSVLLLAVGCASTNPHAAMRGSVVMKVDDSQAHVCLGSGEVKAGDHVTLIRHECHDVNPKASTAMQKCVPRMIGEGVVSEVLNDHYSLVRFPAGTDFHEGDSIEKK